MSYSVKEAYLTLQGEGARSGTVSLFCRFSGCNLWSGLESARAEAECSFCDTDFVGVDGVAGGTFESAHHLADHLVALWEDSGPGKTPPSIVFTGGEPLLQLDAPLIRACHARSSVLAVETNGTLPAPDGLDWICVSPKHGVDRLEVTSGDELKLVYPQAELDPGDFEDLDFDHFFLQPREEGGDCLRHLDTTIEYCKRHPRWKLSLQSHKLIDIP